MHEDSQRRPNGQGALLQCFVYCLSFLTADCGTTGRGQDGGEAASTGGEEGAGRRRQRALFRRGRVLDASAPAHLQGSGAALRCLCAGGRGLPRNQVQIAAGQARLRLHLKAMNSMSTGCMQHLMQTQQPSKSPANTSNHFLRWNQPLLFFLRHAPLLSK